MAAIHSKRRRVEDDVRRPKKKMRVKKQTQYHSSSDEDDEEARVRKVQPKPKPKSILKARIVAPHIQNGEDVEEMALAGAEELERNTALNALPEHNGSQSEDEDEDHKINGVQAASVSHGEADSDSGSDSDSDSSGDNTSMTSSQAARKKKKRNDPTAFATSISKILDTKLTTSKRADPVLSRSKAASEAHKTDADSKLEAAARAQLRAEKKQALEKGRIKDVLGLESTSVTTGRVLEEEKRLKKTAQRGVVRLFNAVRAAQVRAEEGARQAREEGVVGMRQRDERVQEMSKEGFLELISRGGKTAAGKA